MNIKDSDLVRVRSFGELRPGMTVVTKNCSRCGRNHARVLLRLEPEIANHTNGSRCDVPYGWTTAPMPEHGYRTFCFCLSIRDGRLYRLRDLDKADELRRERADRETDPAYRI